MIPKLDVQGVLSIAKNQVQQAMEGSQVDDRDFVARYTAAVAVNFTDWIGKTIPFVRHEIAYQALVENLRCESSDDHVGMLWRFAELSGALPDSADYAHTVKQIAKIRELFTVPVLTGLRGVSLCAALESTSEIFIPDLAMRAKRLGCTDFKYTDVHGEADVAHSDALIKAVEAEQQMGYSYGYCSSHDLVLDSINRAVSLIVQIYTP